MNYKLNIKNRKIYLKPRPKEDIEGGLIVILNKPREEGKDPFIHTDIKAFKKEYDLPELPPGVWVVRVLLKNERLIPKVKK